MSTSRPDESLIVDIANACSIQEAFVEKDYYATVCLRALSEFRHDDVNQVIFTGGTSLTKGWHLMQRFSEDLDFEIITKSPLTRKKTHAIRHALRDCLSRIENIRLSERIITADAGKKETLFLNYEQRFSSNSLRDALQIEFTFSDEFVDTEVRFVNSLIAETLSSYGNVEAASPDIRILCKAPKLIARDKFCALCWRIRKMEAHPERVFDYSVIRHLHDLFALKRYTEEADFLSSVITQYEQFDSTRETSRLSLVDAITETLRHLKSRSWNDAYERFVNRMSYAPDSHRIDYALALAHFETLSERIIVFCGEN